MDFVLEQVGFSHFSADGVKIINEQHSDCISFSTARANIIIKGENIEIVSFKNQSLKISGQIRGIDLEKREFFAW